MKKTLGWVLCLSLLLTLCGCGGRGQQSGTPEGTLSMVGISVDSGYMLVEGGAWREVQRTEAEALLSRTDPMLPKTLSLDKLPDGAQFQLTEVTLGLRRGLQRRVSAIYADVRDLGAAWGESFERVVLCAAEVPEKQIEALTKVVEAGYGFPTAGTSASMEGAPLEVPRDREYAAVIFVPRVYTVRGQLIMENNVYSVEIVYPCVNVLGMVDGIYFVQESDQMGDFIG